MKQRPCGIEVDRGVEGFSTEEIWRHVGDCVLARAGVRRVGARFWVGSEQGQDARADDSGAKPSVPFPGDDDVLWGEVTVHECLSVCCIECIEDVCREPKHIEGA